MLYDFLEKQQDYVLNKCDEATETLAGLKEISPAIRAGWKTTFDQLNELLRLEKITFDLVQGKGKLSGAKKQEQKDREEKSKKDSESVMRTAAQTRGEEYRRLGFTLSDVVHSYGIVCQAITSAASELNYQISPGEFHQLNLSLDVAIALAVTEYDRIHIEQGSKKDIERIGVLAHELRNSLQSAFIALELIESGDFGAKSQTGKLLGRSLQSMKMLIDSALLNVRLKADPVPHLEWLPVLDVASDVEMTSASESRKHVISFKVEVDPKLSVFADRQHFTSALANLTQNAVKFSHPGGNVTLRAFLKDDRANIEVEDECGGLPEAKLKALFQPFEQMDKNKSGLGLGLSISRRAIELSDGEITARNLPGKGCIFTIDLPGRNTGER